MVALTILKLILFQLHQSNAKTMKMHTSINALINGTFQGNAKMIKATSR